MQTLVLLNKPVAVLTFSLPSSMLKLPITYGNWLWWFRCIFVVCQHLEDVQENVLSWKVIKN